MNDIAKQAKTLNAAALSLIGQVLDKHTEAVLEEVHDQIKARNARIAELTVERDALRDFAKCVLCTHPISVELRRMAFECGMLTSEGKQTPLLTGEQ